MTSKLSLMSKSKAGKSALNTDQVKILESLQKIKRRQKEIKKMHKVER